MAAGRLPRRYGEVWQAPFLTAVAARLHPGVSILDVGSGARPVIARQYRPPGCHYVGLDVSAHELTRAGAEAYDATVVGDVCAAPIPNLRGFDLVLSWQVLEHVPSMRAALLNQHAALAPHGRMVAMFSGAWAVYALAARVIPHRVSIMLQTRLLGADARDKFPAHYDGCTDRAMRRLLRDTGWSSWVITPFYKAGAYVSFLRPLQWAYLSFENWAERGPRPNLATHYLVEAVA